MSDGIYWLYGGKDESEVDRNNMIFLFSINEVSIKIFVLFAFIIRKWNLGQCFLMIIFFVINQHKYIV